MHLDGLQLGREKQQTNWKIKIESKKKQTTSPNQRQGFFLLFLVRFFFFFFFGLSSFKLFSHIENIISDTPPN